MCEPSQIMAPHPLPLGHATSARNRADPAAVGDTKNHWSERDTMEAQDQRGPSPRSSRGSDFSRANKPLSRTERLRRLRMLAIRLPDLQMRERLHEAARRVGLSKHKFALEAIRKAIDEVLGGIP